VLEQVNAALDRLRAGAVGRMVIDVRGSGA
jgi:hypothetical protein